MKTFLAIIVLLCLGNECAAQRRAVLSGYIRDSLTGETIGGATIRVGRGGGVTSNTYGYFSVPIDTGSLLITVSHTAYQTNERTTTLLGDSIVTILLLNRSVALEEVVLQSRRRDDNVRQAQMSRVELSMSQIKSLPHFLGEVDLLKTIQLLPGVRNAGEGNAGFYVRGGGPDQNLILLDDAVVYNSAHLFGFFSVFNSDAIKGVTLYKGGMPAQYGGRISSVLDVNMKDGNSNKFGVEGGIGLVASRISLQGPLVKDKSSFIVSARRTYIDALAKPFVPKTSGFFGSGYYFYDLNAKISHRISPKDRLFASAYLGRDVFNFRNAKQSFSANIPWGNTTASLRWNHVFGPRLFANTTLVYNDYKFSFSANQNNFQIGLASGIRDVGAKVDFDFFHSAKHKVKWGVQTTRHKFIPSVFSGRQDSTLFTPPNVNVTYAWESGLYVQDDWELSDKWRISGGLRWASFVQVGPYTAFTRDANGNKLDSSVWRNGELVRQYNGLEPRLTLRYALDETMSMKGSVTRNLQFIHLVSNAGSTLPTDLWIPSTFRVKPQIGWQYAAGFFKNWNNNTWETSVELYYKDMRNQIEYRNGYTPSFNNPEEDFVFGRGWSYGSEWLIKKDRGRLTGWLGYTLSWTWREFAALNGGVKFPAKYDRRHDLSIVGSYELNGKWKLGGTFVYGTGNATTLPERFYFVEGALTQEYSAINAYRLPAYHRLDLSATYTPTPKKERRFKSTWAFGIYNLYSRQNPYFVYFDQEGTLAGGDLQIKAKQVSLFPVLPSVTWNFSLN